MAARDRLRGIGDLARRRRGAALALGLAALAIGALWSASAFTHIDRAQVAEEEHRWVEEGRFAYAVPVVRASPAFPNGTLLGMGEPGYFSTISPQVMLNFTWVLQEPSAPVAASAILVVQVRALGPDGRAYWTLERELANATLAAGQGIGLAGVLDLPATDAEVRETLATLGMQQPETAWTLVARVTFGAQMPWGHVQNTSVFTLPMERAPPLYTLPGADAASDARAHADERVVVRAHQAGLAGLAAAPLAPLLAVAGAAAVALAARRRPSPPPDARDAAFAGDAARVRDWLVEVEGPVAPPEEGERVLDVERLDDLVAMAAEARQRIVLDRYCRVFYVFTPGACYRYRKHGADLASAMALEALDLAERRAANEEPARPRWPRG
ncbi:MAG TPA: DUF5305 family protein [Candidatus Thermoplasmatota archaeon]|jgi:hypothetical protein|nr:DUF5305 family protein [Candidatus Thermoplasmatota archaeon]